MGLRRPLDSLAVALHTGSRGRLARATAPGVPLRAAKTCLGDVRLLRRAAAASGARSAGRGRGNSAARASVAEAPAQETFTYQAEVRARNRDGTCRLVGGSDSPVSGGDMTHDSATAQVNRLLDLIVNSLYSNKDVRAGPGH